MGEEGGRIRSRNMYKGLTYKAKGLCGADGWGGGEW